MKEQRPFQDQYMDRRWPVSSPVFRSCDFQTSLFLLFFVFVFPRSCAQIVIGSSNNDGQDQFNRVSHTFSKTDLLRTLQRSSYHARCLCIQSHMSLNLSVDRDVLLPLGSPSHQWSWFLVAKSEENKKTPSAMRRIQWPVLSNSRNCKANLNALCIQKTNHTLLRFAW